MPLENPQVFVIGNTKEYVYALERLLVAANLTVVYKVMRKELLAEQVANTVDFITPGVVLIAMQDISPEMEQGKETIKLVESLKPNHLVVLQAFNLPRGSVDGNLTFQPWQEDPAVLATAVTGLVNQTRNA